MPDLTNLDELGRYLGVEMDNFGATNAPINVQTDNYTLVLGDVGKVVEMNKASAVNLTVPSSATDTRSRP